MSAARPAEVTVWCNHPDCAAAYIATVDPTSTEAAAFEAAGAEATMAGWQVDQTRHDRHSLDYCPMHHVVMPGEAMPSA